VTRGAEEVRPDEDPEDGSSSLVPAVPPDDDRGISLTRRLLELPILLAVAITVAVLIKTFVAQAFFIPSASMVPQLKVHDRVVVSKLAYHLHDPRRGDIIVFNAPPADQQPHSRSRNMVARMLRDFGQAVGVIQDQTEFIKRVIALPGETVEGKGGHIYINGRLLREPYLSPQIVTSDFAPHLVPAGQVWVMGDNRGNSNDSRFFGTIPDSQIVGRTIWRVWPLGHLSFL
jgi:signal peptidase I